MCDLQYYANSVSLTGALEGVGEIGGLETLG